MEDFQTQVTLNWNDNSNALTLKDMLGLNWPKICRICFVDAPILCNLYQSIELNETIETNTLTKELCGAEHSEQTNLQIKDIIGIFVKVEITENDSLPQQICSECTQTAWQSYRFHKQCEKADHLYQLYTKHLSENQNLLPENVTDTSSSFADNTSTVISLKCTADAETTAPADNDNPTEIDLSCSSLFACVACSKQFDMQIKLKQHIQQYHPVNRELKCLECNQVFAQLKTLTRHLKIHQKDQRNKLCTFCGKTFLRSDDLKRHTRIHTGERPYGCKVCPKKFKQTSELKEHEQSHSKTKSYTCSLCGKCLSTRNGIYVHMKAHRGEKNHHCEYCDNRYITSGELSSHVRHIHATAKAYACTVGDCVRTFGTQKALSNHVKRHR